MYVYVPGCVLLYIFLLLPIGNYDVDAGPAEVANTYRAKYKG